MSSLCWPLSKERTTQKEKPRVSIRYPLVFLGIWIINLLLIFFALPFLLYQALKQKA